MPNPSQTPPTAAEVLADIPNWTDLRPAYRKRLATIVRALPRVVGKPAEAIRLEPGRLGARLMRATAAEWGISAASLPVYRSATRALLRRLGLIAARRTTSGALPEAWRQFLDSIPPGYGTARLAPFALFCADRGLPPSAVSADTLTAYMGHLGASLAVRSPRRTARMVVNAWNTCIGAIPPWEVGLLTMPPPRTSSYAPEFAAYPAAFQAEVAALSTQLGGRADGGLYGDSTDGTPLRRPLRPAALASRLAALRLAAGALVQSGRPITTIIGLRCLVEREARRAICTWHWERAGRRATSNTASVASTLRVIARHAVRLDTAALREVVDDTAPLIPPQTDEITEKNLKRLKQFEDPARLGALLHLPERLMGEAERLRERGQGQKAAWMASVALAVEIELAMPLRLRNLTELRLGHHLQGLADRRGSVHVTIAHAEVKNETTLTFRLGPEAAALLRRYLAEFRPLGPNPGTDFVFPGRDQRDAARQAGGFGKAISEAVRRHIGAKLNPHLFRCLAGVLILRDNPDAIGDLRLLLGHKGLDTTLRFYAAVTREQAAERHVARISKLREDTRLQAMAALGRRSLRRGTLNRAGGSR